jgi:hypothetical protein
MSITGLTFAEVATGLSYEDCIAERNAVMQELNDLPTCPRCGEPGRTAETLRVLLTHEVRDQKSTYRSGGRKHDNSGYYGESHR